MAVALHRGSGRPAGAAARQRAGGAALVPARCLRATHLNDVVAAFQPPPPGATISRIRPARGGVRTGAVAQPVPAAPDYPDLADVKGQAAARRALRSLPRALAIRC